MVRWPLAAALLLLAAASAQPLETVLSFEAPAQASGSLVVPNAQWAILAFDEPSSFASLHIRLEGPLTHTNHTWMIVKGRLSGGAEDTLPRPSRDEQSLPGPFDADLSFVGRPASLVLHADSIRIELTGSEAALRPVPDGSSAGKGLFYAGPPSSHRNGWPLPPGSALLLDAEAGFLLTVDGLRSAEWHNATLSCSTPACPDGGGWKRAEQDFAQKAYLRIDWFHYAQLQGRGHAEGSGKLAGALFGGPRLDATLNGTMRLPLARLEAPCEDCLQPAGQTLTLEGLTRFHSIEPAGGGRLRSGVVAAPLSIRLDETSLALPVAVGAATAGLLIAVLALLRVLPFLASLVLDPEALLRSPTRRDLYESVRSSPGICLSELARQHGLTRVTVGYHVRALGAGGVLVLHRDGNVLRCFENHGRHDRAWRTAAALRGSQGTLHAWLLLRPGTPQRDILEHAELAWGWSRSAAHRRLERLEADGLAEARREGGRKRYWALARPGRLR